MRDRMSGDLEPLSSFGEKNPVHSVVEERENEQRK